MARTKGALNVDSTPLDIWRLADGTLVGVVIGAEISQADYIGQMTSKELASERKKSKAQIAAIARKERKSSTKKRIKAV